MDEETVDIQKEIDNLLEIIKKPVDRVVLEDDLDRYLNKYLLDLESSKRAIIKDYGGSDVDFDEHPTQISQLNPGEVTNINAMVDSQILKITKSEKSVFSLHVHDNSGSTIIQFWNDVPNVKIGNTYCFRNCTIKQDNYFKQIIATSSELEVKEITSSGIMSIFDKTCELAAESDLIVDGAKGLTVHGFINEIYNVSNPKAPKFRSSIRIGNSYYTLICWDYTDIKPDEEVCITYVNVQYSYGQTQLMMTADSAIVRRV